MDDTTDWGRYAPPTASWPLRALIIAGLARGAARKKIIRTWKKRFGSIIDIKTSGIKYRLNLNDNVTDGRILTSHNRYDCTEIKALRAACKHGVFVDIGANVGFYSLSLASTGSQVIAIEPNPKTLARLHCNTALNDFAERVTILPIGIGEEGEFQLISSGDLGSANIRPNSAGHTEAVTISTRPLLDVLTEQNIDQVGGLKIDIEGMEDRALLPFFKNAPKSLWPDCIVIEHCNRVHWENDVIAHMQNCGYNLTFKTRSNSVFQKD
jgi:FkbM family methyltransferase